MICCEYCGKIIYENYKYKYDCSGFYLCEDCEREENFQYEIENERYESEVL